MRNRWDPAVADGFRSVLDECVYGSRLLGSDPALVLHGGGNTSVKANYRDITGGDREALFVKGSGWDLATIELPGFAPLDLPRLRDLLTLESLPDADMMRELAAASFDPGAPAPSVESLLHAFLPHPAVQHSHADVIVTITNLADGHDRVSDVFGDDVVIIPYVMAGFDLARAVAEMWPQQQHDGTRGMVLLNHGLFTFGETTAEAYARHVELISLAEQWLDEHAPLSARPAPELPPVAAAALAELRGRISRTAGRPMIMCRHHDVVSRRFAGRRDLADLATRGPLTPDHVLRTKRVPMVGSDIDAYVEDYRAYFGSNRHRARTELTMLDPAPRVVVDETLGVCTLGSTAKAADIAFDIYAHTMPVLERSEDHLGGYVALEPHDIFDVEYWDLEQAKLRLAGPAPELAGAVALVTGAASGIGRACAAELIERGCAVVGLDLDPSVETAFTGAAWLGLTVDVTDSEAQSAALAAATERYGGIDIVLAAAGIFGASTPISELDMDRWRAVHAVNVDSVLALLSAVHPVLRHSPIGGRVTIIGSRNAAAPGKGAVAYSSSKAALAQVARVAALEWAPEGIRVNVVHPDAVFDTGLWTDALLAGRAAEYGMSVADYKTRNLLGTEVTARGVARVAVELSSDTFAFTTGAQIPVDGGNDRVI